MSLAKRGGVHPAVRILLLVVVALALPQLDLRSLLAIALLGVSGFLWIARSGLSRLRVGLWRLRWLLLAIFVLYAGFTPGEPLLAALPGLSREGLLEGLRRALVLFDLLVLVYLMLTLTTVPQLVIGLRLLLAPLRLVGIDPQRIGLRVALALDGVAELQIRLQRSRAASAADWRTRAATLIEQIEAQAERRAAPVELPATGRPRWWEWLLPLAAFVILMQWLG